MMVVCDAAQCPARALYTTTLGEHELTFCAHHMNGVRSGLESNGWTVTENFEKENAVR